MDEIKSWGQRAGIAGDEFIFLGPRQKYGHKPTLSVVVRNLLLDEGDGILWIEPRKGWWAEVSSLP